MLYPKSYALIFLLIGLLSVIIPQLAFAQPTTPPPVTCLEVPLPNLPGLTVDPCSSPAAYIQYWFYFSLYLAGIAALVIFVIAGAWRIFFATSPESVGRSNRWMINAILGLILLFGSWLLLRTLGGAELTTLRDPTFPPLPEIPETPCPNGDECPSFTVCRPSALSGKNTCAMPPIQCFSGKTPIICTGRVEGPFGGCNDAGGGDCCKWDTSTSTCEYAW